MLRVYFDWNIITELKKAGGGKYKSIKDIIKKYRSALLTPFSNYHVEDLIKNNRSLENIEKFVTKDLEYLEELSQNHFLGIDKDGTILPQIGSPLKFLETIDPTDNIGELLDFEKLFQTIDTIDIVGHDQIKFGELFKSLYKLQPVPDEIRKSANSPLVSKMFPNVNDAENYWDVLKGFANFNKNLFTDKNFLKEVRGDIQETSLIMDSNRGNWDPIKVIENINTGLKAKGINSTFRKLIDSSIKDQKNVTRSLYFTTAYLMLDFYGYKSDKLTKPSNNFLNVTNDAYHSYLAAHCDILVSDDENLILKSKVLYHEFRIKTLVLSPLEFENLITKVVHVPIGTPQDVFDLATSFISEETFVETIKTEDNPSSIYNYYKLPTLFFNYFNYLIIENTEDKLTVLTFRKIDENYSNFVYYIDTKQLLKDLFNSFGESNAGEKYEDIKDTFVNSENKPAENIIWNFGMVHFILEKEQTFFRESLKIVIDVRRNEQ